jgi:hypothetical protein
MIVPNEIVIYGGDVGFIRIVLFLVIEFILVELDLCDSDVIFAHTDWSQVPPCDPIKVIFIITTIIFVQ